MLDYKSRQPSNRSGGVNPSVGGFLQPSGGGIANGRPNGQISAGGGFSKIKDPEDSIPPRLSAPRLWPDAGGGDPGSANFLQDTKGSDTPLKRQVSIH